MYATINLIGRFDTYKRYFIYFLKADSLFLTLNAYIHFDVKLIEFEAKVLSHVCTKLRHFTL